MKSYGINYSFFLLLVFFGCEKNVSYNEPIDEGVSLKVADTVKLKSFVKGGKYSRTSVLKSF